MGTKTYFASDFHLGVDARLSSLEREKQIVRWLATIADDAEALYLVGDIFEFWFEYRTVVPKGYVRLLGTLAELRDGGLPIYFFTGNHDLWMFRYFDDELGIPIYREPIQRTLHGKKFLIGHGDGLGPGDHGYKFLKKVFSNPTCQWLFARVHPNLGVGVANYWSQRSRAAHHDYENFLGAEGEWLIQYANQYLDQEFMDYFIFGHRHLPIDFTLKNQQSRYINLGEWMFNNSYAVFDGQNVELRFFENAQGRIFPIHD